jgi:hypothetical protein
MMQTCQTCGGGLDKAMCHEHKSHDPCNCSENGDSEGCRICPICGENFEESTCSESEDKSEDKSEEIYPKEDKEPEPKEPDEPKEPEEPEPKKFLTEEYINKFVLRLLNHVDDFGDGDNHNYRDLKRAEVKRLLTPTVYNKLTKYENASSSIISVPKKNTLSDDLYMKILHSEVGFTSLLTVILGQEQCWRGDDKDDQLDVYAYNWTLIDKKEQHHGWDFIFVENENFFNIFVEKKIKLTVSIGYDSHGKLGYTYVNFSRKNSIHSNTYTSYDCVVFEGIREDIKKDNLKFFMKSRGDNPKIVKQYTNELSDIIHDLGNAVEFIKEFLDKDVMDKNYYTFINAISDVIDEHVGHESYNQKSQLMVHF